MFHISVKIFPIELIYIWKGKVRLKKSKKKNYAGTPANSLAKDRGSMQTSSIRLVRDLHGPVRCGCGQPGCLPGSALLWRQDRRPRMERKGTVARSLGIGRSSGTAMLFDSRTLKDEGGIAADESREFPRKEFWLVEKLLSLDRTSHSAS